MGATVSLPSTESIPVAEVKPRGSKLALIAVGLLLLLACAAGAWFYFARAHRKPVAIAVAAPQELRSVALEPFLVNLADSAGGEGGSYLRVVMVLRVTDAAAADSDQKKQAKPAEGKPGEDPARAVETAELRDAALGVLTGETSEELLTPIGKDALKHRLLDAFQKHDPQTQVREVLFTEFLVQR